MTTYTAALDLARPSFIGYPRIMLVREVRRGLPGDPVLFRHGCSTTRVAPEFSNEITELPEYYPTRTERSILASFCDEIIAAACPGNSEAVRVVELGAGTASKTTILLDAAARLQSEVLYAPVDVSSDALDVACETIGTSLPGVCISPIVANYVTRSAPARIVQRNYVGVIHRFKHRQLHA